MDVLLTIDWKAVFAPQHSLLELMLRGSLMYLAIFVLLRIMLRRQAGGIGTSDVLVIVLIAEVAGNGIAPNDESVVEGVLLAASASSRSDGWPGLLCRLPGTGSCPNSMVCTRR